MTSLIWKWEKLSSILAKIEKDQKEEIKHGKDIIGKNSKKTLQGRRTGSWNYDGR